MKKAVFILEEKWSGAGLPEAGEAVQRYKKYGIEADVFVTDTVLTRDDICAVAGTAPDDTGESCRERICETLFITDSKRFLGQLADAGAAVCAYRHGANQSEDLSGADYILMEPQWVDEDSLTKIWQRQRGIPWKILETRRCVVREFMPDDLEGICALYDPEARRFLEPPSDDRRRELEILRAYIDRVYRLAGYGSWAVTGRESGELIGRMGFSFPPAAWAGPEIDAVYGYLVRADMRGRGIASEVGRALIEYGFEQLGFETIGADASIFNSISDKILKSFGFVSVAEQENQRYYILHKKDWRNRS